MVGDKVMRETMSINLLCFWKTCERKLHFWVSAWPRGQLAAHLVPKIIIIHDWSLYPNCTLSCSGKLTWPGSCSHWPLFLLTSAGQLGAEHCPVFTEYDCFRQRDNLLFWINFVWISSMYLCIYCTYNVYDSLSLYHNSILFMYYSLLNCCTCTPCMCISNFIMESAPEHTFSEHCDRWIHCVDLWWKDRPKINLCM